MQKFLFIFLVTLLFINKLFSQELDTIQPLTDGPVMTIVRKGSTIYMGGAFSSLGGKVRKNSAVIDINNNTFDTQQFPETDQPIMHLVEDGRGGWFISGTFTFVQGIKRPRIAHILPNYQLDTAWNPDFKDFKDLSIISLSNNLLYVNLVESFEPYLCRIATIDITTAELSIWKYKLDGNIRKIIFSNDKIFVGGIFRKIDNEPRQALAIFNASDNSLLSWNGSIEGAINDMVLVDEKLYFCGNFTNAFLQGFQYLAGIYTNSLNSIPIKLRFPYYYNNVLDKLHVYKNNLYIQGSFPSVNEKPRNGLAAINLGTNDVLPWIPPQESENFFIIGSSNDKLYFGGIKKYGNIAPRILYSTDGVITAECNITLGQSSIVRSSSYIKDNKFFIGGDDIWVGGKPRIGIAATNAITGDILDWFPQFNSAVSKIALSENGKILYAYGDFTKVNNINYKRFVEISTITGITSGWRPFQSFVVIKDMKIKNNKMYIGGSFEGNVIGKNRKNFTIIDLALKSTTDWDISPDFDVQSIDFKGDTLYMVGGFDKVSDQARKYSAAFDIKTQKLLPWQPVFQQFDSPSIVKVYDNKVFIGGSFKRNDTVFPVVAFDSKTAQELNWRNALANRRGQSLAVADKKLYIGCSTFGGVVDTININNLDVVDCETGIQNKDIPIIDNYISEITNFGNSIYIGGYFTNVNNKFHPFSAILGKDTTGESLIVRKPSKIKGYIFNDENRNCKLDTIEVLQKNATIVIRPGDFFINTDDVGKYEILVDTGIYLVEQVLPPNTLTKITKQICPESFYRVEIKKEGTIIDNINFGNSVTYLPFLETKVTSNRRRRCFADITTVTYTNSGFAKSENAKVYVKLPEYIIFKLADKTFTRDKEGNYVFDVGILQPNQSGTITIIDSVACERNINGLTQCTKVWITPSNQREISSGWDKSDIFLSGKCQDNGFVRMGIYNSGSGNMKDSLEYRILINAQLSLKKKFKLNQNDSLILRIPANGRTIRLEADEPKEHPSKSATNVTIENCGTSPNSVPSLGYVTKLPQDDTEPEVSISCLPIVDSYDPNDKQVEPEGTTVNHYTPTDAELKYLIRFQNTGTDTAYTVTVIDTLSENLDIATLQLGSSSHKYSFNLSGKGKPVLTWIFNKINLPDSTKNSLASNGFVAFSIKPKTGLSEKTKIENYADIIFDFNDPVRTNTTFNTIYDVPLTIDNAIKLDEKTVIIPKPVITSFTPSKAKIGESITLKGKYFDKILTNNTVKINNLKVVLDSGNDSTLVFKVPTGATTGKISVENTAGSVVSTADLVIVYPPVISSFVPQTGVPGDKVTISGSNFETDKTKNTVKFGTVSAEVISSTTTSLEVKVPGGFVNEKITVSTTVGDAISTASFAMSPNAVEVINSENISIFPNPTDGKVKIESKNLKISKIVVLNALGKEVSEKIGLLSGEEEIDLSGREKGLYFLVIHTSQAKVIKKLIIQ
jgi:uncharacterized repeat protein (TIGR01451 family)